MDVEKDITAKPYLSIIVPAYNEERRIGSSVETILCYAGSLGEPCEVIVVDDGSTDGTLGILRESAAVFADVRIVTYDRNAGKGYAVRQGIFASRGDYILFSDADLSAPIDELPKLFAALKDGYDVAVGSRAAKGSIISVHQPFYRELGGQSLNRIIQLLAVPGIHDTQCGFKLFRGSVAREVFSKCFVKGWSFDIEVLYLSRLLGYSIAEVPVKWAHNEGSKLNPVRAGLRMIADIICIRRHSYDLGR